MAHDTRHKLINKLIVNLHLNVKERKELEGNLLLSDIRDAIKQELMNNKYYPLTAFVWGKGKPVFEGFFIEKMNEHYFKPFFDSLGANLLWVSTRRVVETQKV